MKRITWCVGLVLLLSSPLGALETPRASFSLAVRPYFSIPVGFFPALAFSVGGGGELLVGYALADPVELDAGLGYELAPFSGEDEMLHLVSIRVGARARWHLLPWLAARIFARGGAYTSISSDPQESVGVHVSTIAGIGAQLHLTPRVSILVDGAYSLYVRKYQGIEVSAGVAIALGPGKRGEAE